MNFNVNDIVQTLGPTLAGVQAGKAERRKENFANEMDLADWALKQAEAQSGMAVNQAQIEQARALAGQAGASTKNIEAETALRNQEFELRPLKEFVDSAGKDIAAFAQGRADGSIADTPENQAAYDNLVKMRNDALKKITGIDIPLVSFKIGETPADPRYLEAVSNIFQLKSITQMAQEMGQDPIELAKTLAKQFHLSPEQMMLLGTPGLPPAQKVDMAKAAAQQMTTIRDNASKAVMELLKNPQVLKWGEASGKWAEEGARKQKQAMVTAMVSAGLDQESATAIAQSLPVFKRTMEAKDEQSIKTRIWEKQMDFQMNRETNATRQQVAETQAEATLGAAQIRRVSEAEVAGLNALTRVQVERMRRTDSGDESKAIIGARQNIMGAINTLNDPLKKGKLTNEQVTQLNGQINQSMSDVMKKRYNITMAPESIAWVRDYAQGQGHSWEGLKSLITAGLVQNKVTDPAAISRMLKAVWVEFGFQASGTPFGNEPEVKGYVQPAKRKKKG